jgi:DNA-directed RNA polymerase subunit RPC12/RpoP
MSHSISLRCSCCQARIKAPYQLRGQTRACPGCGHRFVIQVPRPEDAGPVLVADDQPARRFAQRGRY